MAPTDDDRRKLFTEIPQPQPEPKPGQLSPEQLDHFFTKGYVILKDFFPLSKLLSCRKDIEASVDKLANFLYQGGKIKNLYKNEGFFTRLIHLEKEFPGANILLHKVGQLPKGVQDLWGDERLLNIVEQIIGPDIMGHPVWNLRTKTPNNEATIVPWHQDSAYLDDRALDVMQVTAWIPFLDANEQNGTLQVAEGFHKGKMIKHVCCHRGTWYVEILDDEIEKAGIREEHIKTCNIPFGGVLLFSNMMPHRSLPNFSNKTRWSVDLRWQTPLKNAGFYDLKSGIVFRTNENPNMKPDWETFNSNISGNKIRLDALDIQAAAKDPYDTLMTGPWMKKWEIVNPNRHTEAAKTSTKEGWTKA